MSSPGSSLRTAALAVFLSSALPLPAAAQSGEEPYVLLTKVLQTAKSVSPETAREAQATCAAIGKEVKERTDLVDLQRLMLLTEVETCIAAAMTAGQYADESGDACSHHYESARQLAAAYHSAKSLEGIPAEQFAQSRSRLEQDVVRGKEMGCTGDYAALLASLPSDEDVAAAQTKGIPDEDLTRRFEALRTTITAEAPEQWLDQCRALGMAVNQRGGTLHEVEQWYFIAQVEDCVTRAMAASGYSNDTGDACAHNFLYARNINLALRFNQNTPYFEDGIRQAVEGELAAAKQRAAEMTCTEDYSGFGAN